MSTATTATATIFSFFEGATLTDGQRAALEALDSFGSDDPAQAFILRG